MIKKWLGDNDFLFIRENNDTPKVVMPFEIYILMLHSWCKENGVEVVQVESEDEPASLR